MAYVICSSLQDKYSTANGLENANQFRNQLTNTLVVPIDSEVALTSIRCETASASDGASFLVRLNNFGVTSYNAGKGSISQVIYHAPIFHNLREPAPALPAEVGVIWHEPPRPTYIALNNREELHINEISIDLVDQDEQVLGSGAAVIIDPATMTSTTLSLHIRPRRK